jgi:hypothetical protein
MPLRIRHLVLACAAVGCGGMTLDAGADGGAAPASQSQSSGAVVGGKCLDASGNVEHPACLLSGIPAFTPRLWATSAPRRGACSTAQINQFLSSCVAPATKATTACESFEAAPQNAGCAACLVTPDTAPEYGPFVSHGADATYEINEGGCVALALGETTPAGCGAQLQALIECNASACANCPATDTFSPLVRGGCGCETAAQLGACRDYVQRASCVTPYSKQGNADVNGCLGEHMFGGYNVARYFCLAH